MNPAFRMLILALSLASSGCATHMYSGAAGGDTRTDFVDRCERRGTVRFPWQFCPVDLTWDGMKVTMPPDLKVRPLYLEDPSPALVVWRLPTQAANHVFERDSLELGIGNGFFVHETAAEDGTVAPQPNQARRYRAIVIQVPGLCRQYTLKVRNLATGESYIIDPTIANGSSLNTGGAKASLTC